MIIYMLVPSPTIFTDHFINKIHLKEKQKGLFIINQKHFSIVHIFMNNTCNHVKPTVDTESHYNDVIMGAITSHITTFTIVYSTVYLDADQRKHQSSASLAFVLGIHRASVNSPHKWPVTQKMFPFDDVIMKRFRVS